jgi:hypothetical protein
MVEPILSEICITANVQENVIFTLQNFLFRQNMSRNLKFLTAEKIRFKKNKLFRDRPKHMRQN